MTKTPEELTADWKAGKLKQWKFYYVSYSGGVEPLLLNGENDFINHCRMINPFVKSILAPVPTYDEYKAMQDELAELEELLRECQAHLSLGEIGTSVTPINILLTRINAALSDTLKNPENFNTSDGNVKGDDK